MGNVQLGATCLTIEMYDHRCLLRIESKFIQKIVISKNYPYCLGISTRIIREPQIMIFNYIRLDLFNP